MADNHERDKQGREVWKQVASYIALGEEQERKQIVEEIRELPVPEMKKGTPQLSKEIYEIEWRLWCKIIANRIKKETTNGNSTPTSK